MRIGEAEFGSFVSRYERVLYLCHRNADPDAIGSAFALAGAFGGDIGAATDDLSRTGRGSSRYHRSTYTIDPSE